MLFIILNILKFITANAAVIILLRFLFGYEFRRRKTGFIITAVLFIAIQFAVVFLIKNVETADAIADFVLIVSAMILPFTGFITAKKRTLFIFGFIIPSFADNIVALIKPLFSVWSTTTDSLAYSIFFIAISIAAIVRSKVSSRTIMPGFLDSLPLSIYVVMFIASFSTFYESEGRTDSSYYVIVANLLSFISAVLTISVIIYVVVKFINASNAQKESERQLESEIHHYEDMVKKNQDIRRFRHDYKNNLFSLSTFIKSGQYDEAQQYITDLTGQLELTQNRFATGNYLADAIISDKADTAAQSGTQIDFEGTIPADWISNSDICTLLSNPLDNAISACENYDGAVIRIVSKENDKGAIISILNPVKEKVPIKDNKIKTTKSDKQNHGLGLGNVERTAQKYGGYSKLSCSDSEFEIRIGLKKQEG